MTTTVVITQGNYIPWRGYFDLLRQADIAILLDSVQFTRRDWRNRNVIKTNAGPKWLTIPTDVKGKYYQSIDEALVSDMSWAEDHKRAIEGAYRKASAFREEAPWLFALLDEVAEEPYLHKINETILGAICERLRIDTPFRRCVELVDRQILKEMDPTERLVSLCREVGATRYLSGPTARAYLDETRFLDEGIEVAWMSYNDYPDYPQLWGAFEPAVSIVDLLMNVGGDATRYLERQPEEAIS